MKPAEVPDGPLLVDTDVVSYWVAGADRGGAFAALVEGHELAISFATHGELLANAIGGVGASAGSMSFVAGYAASSSCRTPSEWVSSGHVCARGRLATSTGVARTICGQQRAPWR